MVRNQNYLLPEASVEVTIHDKVHDTINDKQ